MTPEEHGITPVLFRTFLFAQASSSFRSAQLEAALESVRAILGSEERSGFTDSFIRETLYDCYFDVEKSVEWLSGMSCTLPLGESLTLPKEEQERMNAARERKGKP